MPGLIPDYLMDADRVREEQDETRRKHAESMIRARQMSRMGPQAPQGMMGGGMGAGAPAEGGDQDPMASAEQVAGLAKKVPGDIGTYGGYASSILNFGKFLDWSKDEGLMDTNMEVLQDSTQGIKKPMRKTWDMVDNGLSALKDLF